MQSVSARNGGREPKCVTGIWDFGARPAGIKIKMMYCLKSLMWLVSLLKQNIEDKYCSFFITKAAEKNEYQ